MTEIPGWLSTEIRTLTKYWYWEEGTQVALFLIPHLEKDEDL